MAIGVFRAVGGGYVDNGAAKPRDGAAAAAQLSAPGAKNEEIPDVPGWAERIKARAAASKRLPPAEVSARVRAFLSGRGVA